MDRLHSLTCYLVVMCLFVGSAACDDGSSPSKAPKPASRVNAVKAKPKPKAAPPGEFCDVYHEAGQAPEFAYPALAGEAPAAEADGWRWVNIWATWCVPCVEEMPLLARWRSEMKADGLSELVLVSADDTQDKVDKFRQEHPETPDSLRAESPEAIKPWFVQMGLDEAAPLPVHVFVDASNRVRCLRAGWVDQGDRGAIEGLLNP